MDGKKTVSFNPRFEGLSFEEAGQKQGFYHFRKPTNDQSIALIHAPGPVLSTEILDNIDKDYPQGWQTIENNLIVNSHYFISRSLVIRNRRIW